MVSWFIALAFAQEVDCQPSTAVEYQSAVSGAVLSFLAADVGGFESGRDRALDMLPCVAEPIGPAAVQATYQLLAFDGFYSRDEGRRDEGLRALQEAFPEYALPSQFSESHPLRQAWREEYARPSPAPTELPVPLNIAMLIDGEIKLEWATTRPTLTQTLSRDGAVTMTRLYETGAAPPTYDVADERLREQYLRSSVIRERRPVEIVAVAGTALVASGALYGLHRSAFKAYEGAGPTAYEELDRLRDRSNAMALGAGVSFATAAGLGVTAAVVW